MSMTWPCFESGHLLGVVGLDIHLGDLVEDVTYFNQKQNLEAFLIDHHGGRSLPNIIFISLFFSLFFSF